MQMKNNKNYKINKNNFLMLKTKMLIKFAFQDLDKKNKSLNSSNWMILLWTRMKGINLWQLSHGKEQ